MSARGVKAVRAWALVKDGRITTEFHGDLNIYATRRFAYGDRMHGESLVQVVIRPVRKPKKVRK